MNTRWMRGFAVVLAVALAGCAGPVAPGGVDELGVNTYTTWDTNRDNCLDENEFGVGWDSFGEFGAWDTDDDGLLSDDEWGVGVGTDAGEFGAFGDWDMNDDNFLSDDEFAGGGFGVFDDNDDNCIGATEWETGIGVWD